MKTNQLIFVTALCILLFKVCTFKSGAKTPVRESSIPFSEEIASDRLPMNEIIDIGRWIHMDNRIIIQTSVVDTFFYVYTLPDFRYHSRFGPKGQGPDEFLFPHLATDGENKLYIYDNAKNNNISIYASRDSEFVYDGRIPYRNPMIVDDLMRIDDETFFIKESSALEIRFRLLAVENGKLVQQDDFAVATDLRGKTTSYDFAIANYGKNIAAAYWHKNQIHLYRAEDGKIERPLIIKTTGFTKPVKENGRNFFYNDVRCSESYIYVLYQGINPNFMTKKNKSSVIIYNWSGEIIKKLNLDRVIDKMIVDEHAGYIYGVSPYESDYIYRYKFNI